MGLPSMIGDTLSQYRNLEKLGGGLDVVYNPEGTRFGWFVAL